MKAFYGVRVHAHVETVDSEDNYILTILNFSAASGALLLSGWYLSDKRRYERRISAVDASYKQKKIPGGMNNK